MCCDDVVFILFAAIKNRQVHRNISIATIQGSQWLMAEQAEDGKWVDVHTTGNVVATLRLVGYSLNETKSCAKQFSKAAQFFAASKDEIQRAEGARLAYVIMGLNALCKDPSDFMGMNLTARLLKDMAEFPKGEV